MLSVSSDFSTTSTSVHGQGREAFERIRRSQYFPRRFTVRNVVERLPSPCISGLDSRIHFSPT